MPESREIHVHAMSRSGHFAVISWIAAHSPPGTRIVAGAATRRPVHYTWEGEPTTGRMTQVPTSTDAPAYIRDFEDLPVLPPEGTKPDTSILVVRDPWNLLASRLRLHETHGWPADHPSPPAGPKTRALMLDHYIASIAALEFGKPLALPFPIAFDDWRKHAPVRDALGRVLQLSGNFAAPWNYIPPKGNGSSFDHDTPAPELDVDHRYKHYVGHPEMRALGSDPNLMRAATKIWGRPA